MQEEQQPASSALPKRAMPWRRRRGAGGADSEAGGAGAAAPARTWRQLLGPSGGSRRRISQPQACPSPTSPGPESPASGASLTGHAALARGEAGSSGVAEHAASPALPPLPPIAGFGRDGRLSFEPEAAAAADAAEALHAEGTFNAEGFIAEEGEELFPGGEEAAEQPLLGPGSGLGPEGWEQQRGGDGTAGSPTAWHEAMPRAGAPQPPQQRTPALAVQLPAGLPPVPAAPSPIGAAGFGYAAGPGGGGGSYTGAGAGDAFTSGGGEPLAMLARVARLQAALERERQAGRELEQQLAEAALRCGAACCTCPAGVRTCTLRFDSIFDFF